MPTLSSFGITLPLGLLLVTPALAGDPTPAPAAAPAPAPAPPPAMADTRWPAPALKWEKPFGPDGPEMAYVHGDPRSGAFQMFLRMDNGGVSGWHTHDANYTGVVVQGTWQHLVQGETTAANLPVGSAWFEIGRRNHDDRCVMGPCVIFITSEGAQSYHPKTAEGNDPPPPPPAATPAPPPAKGGKKKK